MKRRRFIQNLSIVGTGALLQTLPPLHAMTNNSHSPIVVSTWSNKEANNAAWEVLQRQGSALDAVHQGVMVPEANPNDVSVGLGGLPDRDGKVTLDACIMDHNGNIGAVMALEHIVHAISVARMVMEKTPHVQLVGEGALQFALDNGFKKENLLTDESLMAWKKWLKTSKYNPYITIDEIKSRVNLQHDTIGMLALDSLGNLSGACTTSGMAYKMHGRVGDSPIIGAGLYVDNEIGAATATGVGEEVVRICGSHTIVEAMRYGQAPEAACKTALKRLIKLKGEHYCRKTQIGFIALNTQGEVGAYSLNEGFTVAINDTYGQKILEAKSIF